MVYFLARWSLEELSSVMHMSTSILRRCLSYWLGQGVLKQESEDVYVVLECLEKNRSGTQDLQGKWADSCAIQYTNFLVEFIACCIFLLCIFSPLYSCWTPKLENILRNFVADCKSYFWGFNDLSKVKKSYVVKIREIYKF